MKRLARVAALAVVMALAITSAAFAQGGAGSTGRITGVITDESGAVLPGVTVTATSPALMTPQTVVTNAEGDYRFPSLPVGEYKVTYELAGFATQSREGIRITIGFTGTINIKLGVQSLEETVTVSGESPVIDTTATRVQTNYDQAQLASLPNARDMWSLLSTTPSVTLGRVDVGGSTAGTQAAYYAYGYTGQNRPLIEGINTTEGTSAAGFYLDYGSFEEVFIGAAANSAEMPVPGVLTQFVGKSGGNRFTGSLYFDYENESWQGTNLTPEQVQPKPNVAAAFRSDEANRLAGYKNLNLGTGGPAVKDKLWYYYAYLFQQNEVAQPPSGVIRDGTIFPTKLINHTGKVTYSLGTNNKFIAYLQHGTKKQPYRTDSVVGNPVHITKDSTLNQSSPSWVFKGEYQRTFGGNGFLEVRGGQFGYNFGMITNTDAPRYEDTVTLEVRGGGRDWLLKRRRNQYTAAYSWFLDGVFGGDHNFKLGGEYQDETGNTIWNSGYANQVVHLLSNGRPNQVRLYATPSSAKNGLKNYSAFLTDSFQFKRLTLNVGARFDRYTVWLPEQSHEAGRFFPTAQTFAEVSSVKTFNHVVPRFGAVYDLQGNGKTVLKANFGRFYFNPGVNLADSVNPNTSDQYSVYAWTDPNGNGAYDVGEEGVLTQRFGGTQNAFIDEGLTNSYTHEFSAFIERELITNVGLRVGYVWKKDYNGYQTMNELRPSSLFNVPVNVVDPGVDGVAGTSDDGTIRAFNIQTPIPGSRNVTTNVDGYEGTYKTLEVALNKRFSNRWSATLSYSYTKTAEFARTYAGNAFGSAVSGSSLAGGAPNNPNDATFNEFDNWNIKAHGTVDVGWGIRVTPVIKAQSGQPFGRIVSASLNYGTQLFLVEPIGTRRQENIVATDVRAEKYFTLAGKAKIGAFIDVFNLMNANPAFNLNWTTGPRFLFPSAVMPPRIMKLGIKVDF